MQQNSFTPSDSVLIHGITLNDVERLFNTINEIDSKISKVLENIPRPPQQAASGLYKRREAAKKLGVSLVTLDTWAKAGIIHSRKIGTRIYYTQKDMDEALKIVGGNVK